MEKSLLMQDKWGSNHGYEAMLDFQMSWLMRLAAKKNIKKEKLHKISQEVLLRLIRLDGATDIEIEKVEVWRQWEHIDVIAEVMIRKNGSEERHLVVLEDKAYTMIHDDQLNRYAETVCAYYTGVHRPKYNIHYWVITFHDRDENNKCWKMLKSECEKAEWGLLSFYDVIGWSKDREDDFKELGSDLFEEFWLKEWY